MGKLTAVYTDTHKGRVNFFVIETTRFAYAIVNGKDGEVGAVAVSHEMARRERAFLEADKHVRHYIRPLHYH